MQEMAAHELYVSDPLSPRRWIVFLTLKTLVGLLGTNTTGGITRNCDSG